MLSAAVFCAAAIPLRGKEECALKIALTLLLALMAGFIAFGLAMRWDMWPFVAGYWTTLLLRYLLCDVPDERKGGKRK